MSEETKSMLRNLAVIREEIASTKTDVKHAQANLEASVEWEILQTSKDHLKELETEALELMVSIKKEALEEYRLTNEKPSVDGLALRINHLLRYDLGKVTEWCKENAKALFKLDIGEFEKLAKTISVPGVEIVDEPTITIAQDLSFYLDEKK